MFRSAVIIDYLVTAVEGARTVAYVYFDYQDRAIQNATNVLCSLLMQTLRSIENKSWPEDLFQKLHAKCTNPCNILDVQDVIKLIVDLTQEIPSMFFIFDALDECNDLATRRKLMNFMTTITTHQPQVKFLVTSRLQLPTYHGLSSAEVITIYAHDSDLEVFIRAKIEHKCYDPSLENEIVAKILNRADGLYKPLT
jgi:hypothetical protein